VFFEEWDDPLISGIGWVSELVEIADGIDIFADRAAHGFRMRADGKYNQNGDST
jgi:iron complex transport system substrate-binding protein